jgi:glycosyltransferase involved in cell wall biosynthesis
MKDHIAIVVSIPMPAKVFLRNQIRALSERYDVTVFANMPDPRELAEVWSAVRLKHVPIEREIAPLKDLVTLWRMVWLLRRGRFDLVHSMTPKAGLMAMVGGLLAGVPRRIHTFTGQVWVVRHGFSRWVLKNVDRLIAMAATQVLIDSISQRNFLLAEKVVGAEKSAVLCDGSISGVDLQRFRPDPEIRRVVRAELGIGETVPLLLFVGRFKRDKGVLDLARAYAALNGASARSVLLIVGPDEERLRGSIEEQVAEHRDGLRFMPYTDHPERYMAASDVFCLPSYREGFGSVVIEAAGCEVPTVGSNIYGITDAIVDGQTGLLHEPGDVNGIRKQLQILIEDVKLRTRLGQAARERASKLFPMERLTASMLALYSEMLN